MLLSSGVNVHRHPSLHVFSKRSVGGKATQSNLSMEKLSIKPQVCIFLILSSISVLGYIACMIKGIYPQVQVTISLSLTQAWGQG